MCTIAIYCNILTHTISICTGLIMVGDDDDDDDVYLNRDYNVKGTNTILG